MSDNTTIASFFGGRRDDWSSMETTLRNAFPDAVLRFGVSGCSATAGDDGAIDTSDSVDMEAVEGDVEGVNLPLRLENTEALPHFRLPSPANPPQTPND
jgi:hypothetical protein